MRYNSSMKLTFFTLFIVLISSAPVWSANNSNGCTAIHVKEAMQINRERRELYRLDGNHDAAKIMNRLIFLEKIMLPFSASLDRVVRPLQEKNIPMWCKDLVPMDTVAQYQSQTSPPEQSFKAISKAKIKRLKKSMRNFRYKNRAELYDQIALTITNDLSDHHYNCLLRHFLEAAARSLLLAPEHMSLALEIEDQELVKRSVEKLIRQLSNALGLARSIDVKAAPIQARGIPVLCQEMPPVPWF